MAAEKKYMAQIPQNSDKFREIEGKFRYGLAEEEEVQICEIYQIKNKDLEEQYFLYKKQLGKKNGIENINERELFHGTSTDAVESIIEEGFDWRLSGKNGTLYGKGSYFAKDSSYSLTYCKNDAHGVKNMFVAKVLTGRTIKGDRTFVREPKGFDSAVDNESNPRIFITYHIKQAYPEYLIKFKQKSSRDSSTRTMQERYLAILFRYFTKNGNDAQKCAFKGLEATAKQMQMSGQSKPQVLTCMLRQAQHIVGKEEAKTVIQNYARMAQQRAIQRRQQQGRPNSHQDMPCNSSSNGFSRREQPMYGANPTPNQAAYQQQQGQTGPHQGAPCNSSDSFSRCGPQMHSAIPIPNQDSQLSLPGFNGESWDVELSWLEEDDVGAKVVGSWQSDNDIQARRQMIRQIIQLLHIRKPNARAEWKKEVPSMAQRLEDKLYRSAASYSEYMDLGTLRVRLQKLAFKVGVKAMTKRMGMQVDGPGQSPSGSGPKNKLPTLTLGKSCSTASDDGMNMDNAPLNSFSVNIGAHSAVAFCPGRLPSGSNPGDMLPTSTLVESS